MARKLGQIGVQDFRLEIGRQCNAGVVDESRHIANVLLDFFKKQFNLIRLTHIASIDSGIFTELRGGGFDAVFVHIRQENTYRLQRLPLHTQSQLRAPREQRDRLRRHILSLSDFLTVL